MVVLGVVFVPTPKIHIACQVASAVESISCDGGPREALLKSSSPLIIGLFKNGIFGFCHALFEDWFSKNSINS